MTAEKFTGHLYRMLGDGFWDKARCFASVSEVY